MSDPAAADDPLVDARVGGDGDARLEQLLLSGLDHYFAGRYEQAVHVWTRVLFLDRNHARARAYIERARSALAERQRHSDELLHRGTAAFEKGQVAIARRLLTAAVEHGAPPEVALAYLERLDRLEETPPLPEAHAIPPAAEIDAGIDAVRPLARRSRARLAGVLMLVVIAAGAVWAVVGAGDLVPRPSPRAAANASALSLAEPLPIVRASDVALARARTLFETGHPGDAQRLLSTIPAADPNRAEADRVLAEVQRALLTAADPAAADTMSPVR